MNLRGGFEMLATAPDGVARIRELILSLAVQGKLVPQDPKDPKDEHAPAPQIRRAKPLAPIVAEEKPFDLPERWQFVRLGAVLEMVNGRAFKSSEWCSEGLPIVRIQNLNNPNAAFNYCNPQGVDQRHIISDGDLLISWSGTPGTSFGAFVWDRGAAALNQHIFKCIQAGSAYVKSFLRLAINSQLHVLISRAQGGVGLQHVTKGTLENLVLVLPPVAEQVRIVAKVDELMRLCDELETRGRLEGERHSQLTATLFEALTASESAHELGENWSRVAAHFDLLLDRPEAVDALERTILELAVRGLLLPVDDRNGTTTANSIAQVDRATDASLNVGSYEIPSSWSWIKFGEIMRDLRYGTSAKCDYEVKGVPVLRIPNLKNGRISTEDLKFGPLTTEEVARLALVPGDLLLVRSNGSATLVGSAALVGEESRDFAFAGYLMRVRLRKDVALPTYVLLALETEGVRAQIEGPIRTTSGVKNINSTEVSRLEFPLPPLNVQQRVVAHVDKLRLLCSNMREQLVACHAAQAYFAEALVDAVTSDVSFPTSADGLVAAA
ncbi:restriction endonuclease subunit S [Paraburkholderia phymatum]|uniref:Restriction endonuclease subunit S n=1 Tax=Paraburkholderia phymatum TaxID=148447 RepID=A0ACC6U5S7_9BURK